MEVIWQPVRWGKGGRCSSSILALYQSESVEIDDLYMSDNLPDLNIVTLVPALVRSPVSQSCHS